MEKNCNKVLSLWSADHSKCFTPISVLTLKHVGQGSQNHNLQIWPRELFHTAATDSQQQHKDVGTQEEISDFWVDPEGNIIHVQTQAASILKMFLLEAKKKGWCKTLSFRRSRRIIIYVEFKGNYTCLKWKEKVVDPKDCNFTQHYSTNHIEQYAKHQGDEQTQRAAQIQKEPSTMQNVFQRRRKEANQRTSPVLVTSIFKVCWGFQLPPPSEQTWPCLRRSTLSCLAVSIQQMRPNTNIK